MTNSDIIIKSEPWILQDKAERVSGMNVQNQISVFLNKYKYCQVGTVLTTILPTAEYLLEVYYHKPSASNVLVITCTQYPSNFFIIDTTQQGE